MIKKLLLMYFVVAQYVVSAQCLDTAIPGITLQCTGGSSNRSGVAYNPIKKLYYSANAGSMSYPIETFSENGVYDSSSVQGFDYRGLWWNSNTNQLEGNGVSGLGINVHVLSTSGYAANGGTVVLPAAQPAGQSCGAYDWDNNEIIYYDNGKIYTYKRSDNSPAGSFDIVGLPVAFSNLNSYFIAYTGYSGGEYGVYDYTNRKFYLINKTNATYSKTISLPASAPQPTAYKVAYCNKRLWLFDGAAKIWYSYSVEPIITGSTPASRCDAGTVALGATANVGILNWYASSTSTSALGSGTSFTTPSITSTTTYYVDATEAGCKSERIAVIAGVKNNTGDTTASLCHSFTWYGNTYSASAEPTRIFTNSEGCDSTVTLHLTIRPIDLTLTVNSNSITSNDPNGTYQWIDCDNNNEIIEGEEGHTFVAAQSGNYAVIIDNGICSETSACQQIIVTSVNSESLYSPVSIYPNPGTGLFTVNLGSNKGAKLKLINNVGEVVFQSISGSPESIVDASTQASGVYMLQVIIDGVATYYRLVKQ